MFYAKKRKKMKELVFESIDCCEKMRKFYGIIGTYKVI